MNCFREILRHVTQYISNCPTSLGSTLPYDETSILTKITHHLDATAARSATSTVNPSESQFCLTRVDSESFIGESSGILQNSALFLKFHEQLKASLPDEHKRTALLTFLYYMADSKYSNENGHNIGSVNNHRSHSMASANSALQSIRTHLLHKSAAQNLSKNSTPSTSNKAANTNVLNRQNFMDGGNKSIPTNSNTFNRVCTENDSAGGSVSSGQGSHFLSLRADNGKSLEVQQNINDDIVQNIIYVFTGIQGKYLKKDLISGRFKLDTKAKALNVVQAGMLLRLSELGYYHDLVQSYTDTKSGLCPLGLMGQGFVSALKNELTRYYGMVATLQEQLNRQREYEHNTIIKGNSILPIRHERLTLMKILVWSVDSLKRLQWLATIAEACREKKGGALASTVHAFLNNGNPMVKSLVRELLLAVCGPLYQMLSHWLLEGEINDAHGEFFIECLADIGPDRLWHDKYRLRSSMLPNFVSTEMAHKILVTGKSINFLCEVCEDKRPVQGRDELRQCIEENAEQIFAQVADTKLHSTIDTIYLNTSKRVLDIVMGPHKLLEHLQAMRRYLLLGQGDFIGILMENLKCELDKPAKELYSYDLSSIMDAAIRSTNAQYDDPEILNHLDVRLLTPCDGDIGWDILSLQYTVRGPLATMLEPCMGIYQMLFKPLWRMRHMEFVLSSKIWKDQKCNAKPLRSMGIELNQVLYRLHLLTSEMIHFIHQMQYYILFEVIECSWAELQDRVQQAKALDDILDAHDDFLNAIKCGAFLDSSSGQLCQNMENVYDGIIRLELWQDKFYEICFQELSARKEFEQRILTSEVAGEFGVTAESQLERDQDRKIFDQLIGSYHKSLDNICADYEKGVRCFLLALNSHNDHNLQLFGIRLDFNEYYKKRDQRLCVPLTFEHMRMSIMFNGNKSLAGSRYSTVN
ncbi:gamma-tubulin complex component 3 homolog isoform X2 [Ceratitis capitata]|uniref:gamma-tubulin complex component 3 homolog isoform X2 n=1 Tax=Ceratitis capitata TaxID=7213 RepID=UPI0006187F86|nr:gamma-tubulin complex component 3 homolog isoform X2 [Ceratitis capitata]